MRSTSSSVAGAPRTVQRDRDQRPGDEGGALTGPNPTDRGKGGSKYHLLVDAAGLPLNVLVSAANRHDSLLVEPIWTPCRRSSAAAAAIPAGGRSSCTHALGYDNPRVRRYLRRRGITARIARIGRDSGARLGRHRWVVERTLGWLLGFRRLALRYDRTVATLSALLALACAWIGHRRRP